MHKTGTFLKIWLIIMYILFGLVVCCSGCVVYCLKSNPEEAQNKDTPAGGN